MGDADGQQSDREQLHHLRRRYLLLAEHAVHDRRRLVQQMQDAGLVPVEPKEGLRQLLGDSIRAAGGTVVDHANPGSAP